MCVCDVEFDSVCQADGFAQAVLDRMPERLAAARFGLVVGCTATRYVGHKDQCAHGRTVDLFV